MKGRTRCVPDANQGDTNKFPFWVGISLHFVINGEGKINLIYVDLVFNESADLQGAMQRDTGTLLGGDFITLIL